MLIISNILQEWVNPIMTYEVGVDYESEVSKFKSFMLASSRYNSLFGDQTDQNIVRKPNARSVVLLVFQELKITKITRQPVLI